MASEMPSPDPRNIRSGWEVPSENYADQPYVVVTKQGHWLCTLTTGRGQEGQAGQHIVAATSTDRGRTWSRPVNIEPADGPEASWVVPLVAPGGRVFAFYTYNAENRRTVKDAAGRPIARVDTLGRYVFKVSDDGGRTWSARRYEVPIRTTAIDRGNVYGGEVKLFWNVCKPIVAGGAVLTAIHKVGNFGPGFMVSSEGFLFRSEDLLTAADPAQATWTMWPAGEQGLHTRPGAVSDEHNLVALSGGGVFCMFRTTTGHPWCTYSRDGGRTWEDPAPAAFAPGGRLFRHPRACPRIWRTQAGEFLFWFHNHGGRSYADRNPAWIVGGVERDGRIHWSQPEVLLYDPDPKVRISYPDLVEQDGRYWVTETQKSVARVHEIDAALLKGLWAQGEARTLATKGLVISLDAAQCAATGTVVMPRLPDPSQGGGLAIDLWLTLGDLAAGQVVLDSRTEGGAGLAVTTGPDATLQLSLSDGKTAAEWASDAGRIEKGKRHHVVFIADGGPKLITVVLDGVLCDGTSALPAGRGTRQFGWGRFPPALGDVPGGPKLRVAPSLKGTLHSLRLYTRHLRTSEAIANFHGALPPEP